MSGLTKSSEEQSSPRSLSAKRQALTVAGFALVAGLMLIFLLSGPGNGQSTGEADRKPTYFVPSSQQAAEMHVVTIGLRNFHTETITDGYVAANGGWTSTTLPARPVTPGIPVLADQSSDLLQAENDLVASAAQLRVASASERRLHALYMGEGAALKDWQQSQTDATTAAASLENARNKLRLLGKSDAEMGAILSSARSAAGEGLSPGAVFTVGDSSLVWLVANIREADAAHVHKGDMADVRVFAVPDRIFKVQISYLSGTVDPVTHRLLVGGLYRNDDHALKPNMLATFDVAEQSERSSPAVPSSAIVYEGDQTHIWIVDANGRYVLRRISVGRSQAGFVEVLRGVSVGEKAVAGGALFVDQEMTSN